MASSDFLKASAKHAAVAKKNTPKLIGGNMAAVETPKAYTGAQATELALDLIPGARLLANTVETVKGNKVSPEKMQAGYVGVLPLAGAVRAAANSRVLAPLAAKAGADIAAAKTAAQLAIASTKRGNVAVRFPSDKAADIVQSGGLTNAFETIRRSGLRDAEDVTSDAYKEYLAPRIRAEQEVLGIPENATATQRPVYGFNYLPGLPVIKSDGPIGLTSQALSLSNPGVRSYGDVTGLLKSNASKDATFTIGDSFTKDIKAFGLSKLDKNAKSAVADAAAKSKIESYRSIDEYIGENMDQYKESYKVYKDMFRPEDAWITGESTPKTWDDWLAASKKDFFTGEQLAAPVKNSSSIGYIEAQLPFASGNINNFKKFIADSPQAKQAVEAALREAGIKTPVKLSLEAKAKALQEILRRRK